MEKEVYYAILCNDGWDRGSYLLPKIFIKKEKALKYAEGLFVTQSQKKLKDGILGSFTEDIQNFLYEKNFKLNSKTKEKDLKHLFQLLQNTEQAEDELFINELELVTITEVPIYNPKSHE